MTLNEVLTMFGGTISAAAVYGFVFGVIIFWVPRNAK